MLNMDLILYKYGKVITKVKAKHWWLAVFKLGMFSKPRDLSMDVNITFPNHEMLEAFLKSFKKLGYKSKDFMVIDNTFCFKYIRPKTRKVWTRSWLTDSVRQHINRKNTELYNKYLDDFIDDNKIDDSKDSNEKVILVNELLPKIIKNTKEDEKESKNIIKDIYNKENKNIVLVNNENEVIK